MQWLPPPAESSVSREQLREISFDLIRASANARQATSVTRRALDKASQQERVAIDSTPSTCLHGLFAPASRDATPHMNGETNA